MTTPCTPDRFRRADERAKVLRVVQRIKYKDKRLFVLFFGMVKDIDHIAIRIPADLRDDSLIVLVDLVQPRPLRFDDLDLSFSRQSKISAKPALLPAPLRQVRS